MILPKMAAGVSKFAHFTLTRHLFLFMPIVESSVAKNAPTAPFTAPKISGKKNASPIPTLAEISSLAIFILPFSLP